MRLSDDEFRAMNTRLRRFFHRWVEYPAFRWVGLQCRGLDVLEIGCGSGYGAVLLSRLGPRSYLGIDLMPEMIELARRQGPAGAEFRVLDASNMPEVAAASKDAVAIFGILHHIPKWRGVLAECHRVLRPGGRLFLEEPVPWTVRAWDRVFHWEHPEEAMFGRKELESQFARLGFAVVRRLRCVPAMVYCVRKPGAG